MIWPISPDGQRFAAGTGEDVRIVDIAGAQLGVLKGHTGEVRAVCISIDGKRIVSGSDDGTLRVWDAKTYKHLLTFDDRSGTWKVVSLHDGQRVLSSLRLWDVACEECLKTLVGANGVIFSIAVARDSKRAV